MYRRTLFASASPQYATSSPRFDTHLAACHARYSARPAKSNSSKLHRSQSCPYRRKATSHLIRLTHRTFLFLGSPLSGNLFQVCPALAIRWRFFLSGTGRDRVHGRLPAAGVRWNILSYGDNRVAVRALHSKLRVRRRGSRIICAETYCSNRFQRRLLRLSAIRGVLMRWWVGRWPRKKSIQLQN